LDIDLGRHLRSSGSHSSIVERGTTDKQAHRFWSATTPSVLDERRREIDLARHTYMSPLRNQLTKLDRRETSDRLEHVRHVALIEKAAVDRDLGKRTASFDAWGTR
jgi:hypothetical protein